MSFADLLRSVGGVFAHRLRAALTLLGIVIGTGSIVLLASLLHGGRAYLIHADQEAADPDVVEAHGDAPPPDQRDRTTRPLSRADAAALAKTEVGPMVAAESSRSIYARYEGRRKRVAIVSAGRSTLALYRLAIATGRALDEDDRSGRRRVCVVGREIYDELLRGAPLASTLRLEIDGHLFAVVGVLVNKPMLDATDATYVWNRKVMIPETTYDALYAPSHEVGRIYVRAAERQAARETVRGVLLRRHHGVVNFALAKDESGGMEAIILAVVQVLLLGTGVLALLASGINIMNVMLVTVSERTREIGLRRAIGASPRSILVHFLLEATTLSLVGAVAGLALGALLSWAIALGARAAIGQWELVLPPWSLATGLGLAVLTGLVSGVLPAWRAARVSPIEALRAD